MGAGAAELGGLAALTPGTTYLFEAIYLENRIVVRYAESSLVLLAAYAKDGRELGYEAVQAAAAAIGTRAARRQAFSNWPSWSPAPPSCRGTTRDSWSASPTGRGLS